MSATAPRLEPVPPGIGSVAEGRPERLFAVR
jgi:hypothetical protein